MAISLDIPTLTLIADISTPHMKAINEAVTAAFPNDSDAAYTLALGVQLSALLYVLDPTVRPKAVEAINRLLEKNRSGYKLVNNPKRWWYWSRTSISTSARSRPK